LDHQDNYVGNSSLMSNAAKSFSLSVLHNYFDDSNKIIFRSIQLNFSILHQNYYFHVNIKEL